MGLSVLGLLADVFISGEGLVENGLTALGIILLILFLTFVLIPGIVVLILLLVRRSKKRKMAEAAASSPVDNGAPIVASAPVEQAEDSSDKKE